jgi:uncharacterized protein with GYD domain
MAAAEPADAQHYVLLATWSSAGMPSYDDLANDEKDAASPDTRAKTIEDALVEVRGGELVGIWWTLGEYDMVVVIKADFAKDVAAFALALSELQIRTVTMPAFDPAAATEVFRRAKLCGDRIAGRMPPP